MVRRGSPMFFTPGLRTKNVLSSPPTPTPDAGLDWLPILYLAGVAICLIHRALGIREVRRIMHTGRKELHDGIEVIVAADPIPPFSFAGRIVLSQSDYASHAAMIVSHEQVHIRERHAADLWLINSALALQWFNPFVRLLRRELILTHELAADRGVIRKGIDAKQYQYLLIAKGACPDGWLPVANRLSSSNLRTRIRTMKRTTNPLAQLKLLLVLPLVGLALVAFAQTDYIVVQPEAPAAPEQEAFHQPFQSGGTAWAKFGERPHPLFKGRIQSHSGIDVVPANDTIRAPYSGVVTFAAYDGNMGNKLVITHRDGLETTYAHLAKFLVTDGAQVQSGEPIAIVGSTGLATGKHLHFEARVDGELVDPEKALPLDL